MSTFKIYNNSNLTTEFTGFITANQNVDGSTGMQKFQKWIGSTASGRTLQAESNPGVDQIVLSVTDAAAGSGHPVSDISLALTSVGLDSATPGASLNLGTSILSGVVNAKEIWIGVEDSTGVVGTSTELTVTTNLLRES
jgi:hypothetical protein